MIGEDIEQLAEHVVLLVVVADIADAELIVDVDGVVLAKRVVDATGCTLVGCCHNSHEPSLCDIVTQSSVSSGNSWILSAGGR